MSHVMSPLTDYVKLSPMCYQYRGHKIDTITIHHMAGNLTVETCGQVFQTNRASSNYGVGSDGRIGCYVPENWHPWTTADYDNDDRAVTIEVANDRGEPDWHVSDAALEATIELVADICRRNNIDQLRWRDDPGLIGQIDKQNMTVHRWFMATTCPGPYLLSKHGYIADRVNALLGDPAQTGPDHQEEPGDEYDYIDVKMPILGLGDEGNAVVTLQEILQYYGYDLDYCGGADGIFGEGTESAVKSYQRDHDLDVDGVVGAQTWGSMLRGLVKSS